MERFKPKDVYIEVTTNGPGDLHQRLSFPNGTEKSGPVRVDTCDEGEEVFSDLSRRQNPVYVGTQKGWYDFVNRLLASRGQHIDFPT
jgi:hypothetical protein